jgi:hypothetical protein
MRGWTLAMAGEVGDVDVGDAVDDVFLPMFAIDRGRQWREQAVIR